MLDPMKHNYMKKIMKLYQDGKLPPPGVAMTDVFSRVMEDAARTNQYCAGVLILTPELSSWQERIAARPSQTILVHPVKLKQLLQALSVRIRDVQRTARIDHNRVCAVELAGVSPRLPEFRDHRAVLG